MNDEIKPKKQTSKTFVALKNLSTKDGQVKKGCEFKCTAKEAEHFKKAKAI